MFIEARVLYFNWGLCNPVLNYKTTTSPGEGEQLINKTDLTLSVEKDSKETFLNKSVITRKGMSLQFDVVTGQIREVKINTSNTHVHERIFCCSFLAGVYLLKCLSCCQVVRFPSAIFLLRNIPKLERFDICLKTLQFDNESLSNVTGTNMELQVIIKLNCICSEKKLSVMNALFFAMITFSL
jgi:hypothetical protein